MNTPTSFTTAPIIISKMKGAYANWLNLHKNIPKTERFTLGQKISELFILLLEQNFVASFSTPSDKLIILENIIPKFDLLKFFIQIAWENKLIPLERYAEISGRLDEIGRMLGGWRKDIKIKLSPQK